MEGRFSCSSTTNTYTSNMQHRLSNLQGFAGFTGYILYEAVVLLTLLSSHVEYILDRARRAAGSAGFIETEYIM